MVKRVYREDLMAPDAIGISLRRAWRELLPLLSVEEANTWIPTINEPKFENIEKVNAEIGRRLQQKETV